MKGRKASEDVVSPEEHSTCTSPTQVEKDEEFKPINEIQFKFLLQDTETVTEGLSKFIQTCEAFSDGVPCPDVVAKYLRSSPGCSELLALLDPSETPLKTPGIALVFKCLEQVLTRIRNDSTKSLTAGESIVHKVLASYMRQVYSCLQASNKSNFVKAGIQLLISMVMLSEKCKKSVQARLNFSHVHFSALFKRRNRKDEHDVRSCMVLLTLAFLVNSDSGIVTFMVQQKTFLHLTISGLKFDAKEVVVDVLLTLLDKVVRNSGVSKTDKVKLFSEVVLRQLAELYFWQGPQAWSPGGGAKHGQDGNSTTPGESAAAAEDVTQVADVADTFLQELCCSSRYGVSFNDRTVGTGARSQNQLLSHFLSWLTKYIDEPRKAALMVNILASNPDLVCGVLTELQPSLEPRWSDSWANLIDWLVSLYNALPDRPQCLCEPEKKTSEQRVVAMATVFCLPPFKATLILNQSLRHEDIRVRQSYLELVQSLARKACVIQKALLVWSADQSYKQEDSESLRDLFTATVLKGLPSVHQLFDCVDKVTVLTSVGGIADKPVLDAIEAKLGVALDEHACLLFKVLGLYQVLTPSLLTHKPKDVSKLIQLSISQLTVARDTNPDTDPESASEASGACDTDGVDSKPPVECHREKMEVVTGTYERQLPQLYLLKLLSEMNAQALSLGREGVLEKLLFLAQHNNCCMDLTVCLICKMLQSMEVFSGHKDELSVWVRNALDGNGFSSEDNPAETEEPSLSSTPRKSNKDKNLMPSSSRKPARSGSNQSGNQRFASFLASCLSSLVNNPTPYSDRVAAALIENPDEDGKELRDMRSTANEESIKEILLMDDGELDKLVASTATGSTISCDNSYDDETMVGKTNANVAALPVSPLVLVALDQLSSDKKGVADVRVYVSRVLVDLTHCLADPIPLARIVTRSGHIQQLHEGAGQYLTSFLPSQPHSDVKDLEPALCGPFASLLLRLRRCDGSISSELESPKKFQKYGKQIQKELSKMPKPRRLTGLGQVMLYMGGALSGPSEKTASVEKTVHLYRLTIESLLDLLMEKQEVDAVEEDTTLSIKSVQFRPADEADKKPGETLLGFDFEESIACEAVRRVLLDSTLLKFIRNASTLTSPKAKTSKLKTSSLLSADNAVVRQVLCLMRNVLQKSYRLPWFKRERDLIQQHVDTALSLVINVLQQADKEQSRSKTKDIEDGEERESAFQYCCQIISLLYKSLPLVSLSQSLAKLLKLFPYVALPSKRVSKLSKLVEVLTFLVLHWADSMAVEVAPSGMEVLLGSRNNLNHHPRSESKTSLRCASHDDKELVGDNHLEQGLTGQSYSTVTVACSSSRPPRHNVVKLKILPSFEEVCGLDACKFKSFFDFALFAKSDSELLKDCALKVLTKVPDLLPLCADSVPLSELSSPLRLESCVGREVAVMLIKSEKRIFEWVDSWLQSCNKKLFKNNQWWLAAAFLEAKHFSLAACEKSVAALKASALLCFTDVSTASGEDATSAFKLLCSSVGKNDLSFQAAVITSTAGVIQEHPSLGSYDLFFTCTQFCPTVPNAFRDYGCHGKDLNSETLLLNLTLRHLNHLVAEKKRQEVLEDYLLSLAVKLISTQMDQDLSFLADFGGYLVKNTLKHLYKNPKLLELLCALAPSLYKQNVSEQQQPNRPNTTAAAGTPQKAAQVLTAQTLFQMCCSHTAFLEVMMAEDYPEAKASLVKLLFTLGELEPACYDKLMKKVLVGAYTATLSLTDQRLLRMIETVSCDSDGKFDCPMLWGKRSVDQHSVTQALGSTLHNERPVAEVLAQLDVKLLRRSTLNFPVRRTLKGEQVIPAEDLKSSKDCYDPRFLLRLLAQTLTPDKRVPLHEFVDKGCLGYLFVALSSHDLLCRLLAYQALNDLHLHAQGSRWSERSEVSFLLDLLNASRSHSGQKLSFVVALFFAWVSRLFLYPADGLYMPIFRFLVARPEMDLKNVPEFYKLFFSPGSNFRQERNWTLSLLVAGLRETSDYWLYQKKSVFKIIFSFYSSAISDQQSQALVLSIVKSACVEKSVAVHLVKNHGLLAWLAAAVAALAKRPEHSNALCEIVHTLWTSLISLKHLEETPSKGRALADTKKAVESAASVSGVKNIHKEMEAMEDDSCDSDDADDDAEADDSGEEKTPKFKAHEKENNTGGENSTDEEEVIASKSRKRKQGTKTLGMKKRCKLSKDSVDIVSSEGDETEDIASSDSGEDGEEINPASGTKLETEKSQKRKKAVPTVPKATMAELGLIVKSLTWHLSEISLSNIGKLIKVHLGLVRSGQSSPITHEDESTSDRETRSNLATFSGVEACLILHRLGMAAQLEGLVTAVEGSLASQGVCSPSSRRVTTGKAEKKAQQVPRQSEDTEKTFATDQGEGEEEGKVVLGLQAWEESLEGSGEISVQDCKAQAEELLAAFKEVVALTCCVEFV